MDKCTFLVINLFNDSINAPVLRTFAAGVAKSKQEGMVFIPRSTKSLFKLH
jgi:hypothetical protein